MYRSRLRKLEGLAEEKNVCGALIVSASNVFYFTGFKGGFLLYSRNVGFRLLVPALEYLRAYDTVRENALDDLVTVVAYKPYGLPGELKLDIEGEEIVEGKAIDAIAKFVGKGCILLTDADSKQFISELEAKELKLQDASKDIALMRALKEPWEIERMTEAARIAEAALNEALANLEPGVTELEIAAIIEREIRVRGAEDHSFPPIVAFGKNTVYPHAIPSARRRLEDGQPVLIDLGAVYKGYCSDMTRTVDFGGVGDEFTAALRTVIDAVEAAIDAIEPGKKIGEVDAAARRILEKHGYAKYFIHSLGHGVGIDVHEYPRVSSDNNDELKPGMVITIEPGVYIPGKFGVRVEEMVLVTERGPRLLTRFPRELWV
ncbi:M24 family metallopeptidase [Hyperthermus butylicus]|uniref:Xaa-Pro dipeptidase n=1 Tax=Hyperthermus butylicus (strain DSM 5456 / JCM 9403 / PLM1-5) TaxID=415426 RepID=A2BK06_HYPBU|nr:Xaa-Pro peptidase family protein [Hyperthermus butylicus]ABM80317.1 Xaa-Pro dipeptidase [Hyperthermus butylicus DSM 5456]